VPGAGAQPRELVPGAELAQQPLMRVIGQVGEPAVQPRLGDQERP
jgi:hypothetical protein